MSDPRDALRAIGELADDEIDIADAALHVARALWPSDEWQPAGDHLHQLARAAVADVPPSGLPEQGDALARVLTRQFGYRGSTEDYDAEINANLIAVIERRRGLPVALGILWLHAARAAGARAVGLDFPGHFLVALRGEEGEQVVLDPFAGGVRRDGRALRTILRSAAGPQAELTPAMVRPMPDRAILLRLLNNLRLRRARAGNLDGALAVASDMLLIAPRSPGLWEDAAQLHEAAGRLGAAVAAWERALALTTDPTRAAAAYAALATLRARLQ